MRLRDLAPFLPIGLLVVAPLACSSTTTSNDSGGGDAGDQGTGDDGGDTTGDGGIGSTKDAGPPFVPGAFPGGYPQVPNNGGGVVTAMRLVSILPAGESTVQHFGEAFPASATFAAVAAEYGLGTPAAGVTITGGAITAGQLEDNAIQSYISSTISSHSGIAPDGHTIYLLFLPTTSWLSYNGQSNQGCHQNGDPQAGGIGGYHVPYGNNGDGWGVVQHCTGLQGETDPQELEIAASHEVIEAVTDVDGQSGYSLPQPQQDPTGLSIWDDVLLTEVGDLCVNTQINDGAYTYQRFWSNTAAKSSADPCIPAIPLFFNTGTVGADSRGWFTMSGSTMTIPIEGFSTAALAPWIVASAYGPQPVQATEAGWSITVTGTGTSQGQATIGNGEKGTVTITASGATSGSWAEFELVSAAGISGESEHVWPFGVRVP